MPPRTRLTALAALVALVGLAASGAHAARADLRRVVSLRGDALQPDGQVLAGDGAGDSGEPSGDAGGPLQTDTAEAEQKAVGEQMDEEKAVVPPAQEKALEAGGAAGAGGMPPAEDSGPEQSAAAGGGMDAAAADEGKMDAEPAAQSSGTEESAEHPESEQQPAQTVVPREPDEQSLDEGESLLPEQQRRQDAEQQLEQKGKNVTEELRVLEQVEREMNRTETEAQQQAAKLAAEQADRADLDPAGESNRSALAQAEQVAKDEADEKNVGLSDDLEDFLKPSYKAAVGMTLAVDVPAGLSPVDAAKFRIEALRRRLKSAVARREGLERARAEAQSASEQRYADMEKASDALHDAYLKHEIAARGADIDHIKGDPTTLNAVIAAAGKVLKAQEEHFSAASTWSTSLPLAYDQELALDNTRMRLQRTIGVLEAQLAESITKHEVVEHERVAKSAEEAASS